MIDGKFKTMQIQSCMLEVNKLLKIFMSSLKLVLLILAAVKNYGSKKPLLLH